MSYVLADGGELARELDDETRDAWIVRVGFQEVAPSAPHWTSTP